MHEKIANWTRFRSKFPEYEATLAKIVEKFEKLPEGGEKERLAKLLNVEFGIAILRENEIDRESFSKMLEAIAK